MNISIRPYIDSLINEGKKSNSQIYGKACERWVEENLHCPICSGNLKEHPPNEPSKDHFCLSCGCDFQIKSSKKISFSKEGHIKILGAEYSTTLRSVGPNSTIDYLLIEYDKDLSKINSIYWNRASDFGKNNVIPRNPLSHSARRAGWQGCTLVFKAQNLKQLL
jgi:type II restriction enzyme